MNRVSDKIEPIHKRIFCLRSGTSAHTQKIAQFTRMYISTQASELGQDPPVFSAAKIMQHFIYNYKDMLQAAMICAGWDPYKGPQIYNIPLGGTIVQEYIATGGKQQSTIFFIKGSGSVYMSGFCDTQYKVGMSKKECRDFVLSAVSLAMFRDSGSGGIVRLLDVNKDGIKREYITREELPIK